MAEAKRIKEQFDDMKALRSNWDTMYQVLGEYISLIKQNFEGQPFNGEFLIDDIFDSTGAFAAHNAASALLGMLWGGSAEQTIEIVKPNQLEESTEIAEFYEQMNNELIESMDNPKANLALALDEYMLDQMIFGTSGVGVELGEESDLEYTSYSVTELYIDEGKSGRVNKIALFYEWDARRVVDEYGEENVSEKVRKCVKEGKKEKVKILVMIQPRKELKAVKGKLAMPFESIHMEYDDNNILREEGFNELPIAITRFRKLGYEKYGRSAGMNALSDIKEMNALRESGIIATEKGLDMPLGVYNDGVLGGGYLDTSPRAVNVFNQVGSGTQTPVFEIGQPPRVDYVQVRYEELKESISQHFGIDRLLDFNNDTQMTFGEAQIRDNARLKSLLGLFARQISELFTPLIERSINIKWRRGDFGVVAGTEEELEQQALGREVKYVPDAIVDLLENGKPVYKINYKTTAKQASRAEDYIAIIDVLQLVGQVAQVDPSILNRIDSHKAIQELGDIRSLPVGIIREDDAVEEIEAEQQEQAKTQQMMETIQQGADVAKTVADAESKIA